VCESEDRNLHIIKQAARRTYVLNLGTRRFAHWKRSAGSIWIGVLVGITKGDERKNPSQ